MNRFLRTVLGLIAIVAVSVFSMASVEAGWRHHHGRCHQPACGDDCAVVVEDACATECEPECGSHHGCGHHRRHCHGLFGHRRHCHRHHHACEPVACDSGCDTGCSSGCGDAVVVTEGCAGGGCSGGEVVSEGPVVTHESAPAAPAPRAVEPTPAPPAPEAPKAAAPEAPKAT